MVSQVPLPTTRYPGENYIHVRAAGRGQEQEGGEGVDVVV